MGENTDSGQRRQVADGNTASKDCDALEDALAALRNAYEQYFMGIERQPPAHTHRELKKRMDKLRNTFVRSTAVKFRVQSLHSKFVTYERLWARTIQEMENGTYRRDVFKARLRAKALTGAALKPSVSPVPSVAAPDPAVRDETALSDAKIRAVFDAYVTAKRQCNEDTSKVSLEGLTKTLKKQVPELLKKHNAKAVDFKVVIKDGKAVLKAVPRE